MKIRKLILMASTAALLGFALLGVARSQDAPPQQEQNDPNQPGVARLSFIHGDVSTQRGDSGETSAATLNTPLEAGDKILTGPDSRTEVQLDSADILRLDQNAQANITTLANNRVQVQVGQGLANYSVMKGGSADVEIDTPCRIPKRQNNGSSLSLLLPRSVSSGRGCLLPKYPRHR